MQEHILMLKLLSDPTRMKILKLILDDELCVCQLQEIMQISQPAISQHLAKLKVLGLVQERRDGLWTYYRGNRQRVIGGLQAVVTFMEQDLASTDEMRELAERRDHVQQTPLCSTGLKGTADKSGVPEEPAPEQPVIPKGKGV